jgi:uncharacterized membrane protein
MSSKLNNQTPDFMSKDPANWRGPFYFNRKDPRIGVPKIDTSRGWTFNMANPYTHLMLAVIIVLILLFAFHII